MPKRPGHVNVNTEVGYCPFCNRARNLRREDHVMGDLMRSTITCETCHRTLSSTMGPATAQEDSVAAPAAAPEPVASAPAEDQPSPVARATRTPPKPADKPAARKPRAATTTTSAKPKPKAPAKAPATRRTTKG